MIKNMLKILILAAILITPSVALAQKKGSPTEALANQPPLTQAEVDNYCKQIKLVPIIMSEDPKAIATALEQFGVSEKRFLYIFFKIHTYVFIEQDLAKPEDFDPKTIPTPDESILLSQNREKISAAMAKLERK